MQAKKKMNDMFLSINLLCYTSLFIHYFVVKGVCNEVVIIL